ncbi:putative entry exclusion protein TrbK-alt [Algihabitans albus]|uniref:putative entry exclusion protein TrbK-alt n=1 Tax=Algihabitans albus TaxID=2164067 RepID=UPI000E5CEF8F|nr:putative entry exclusion protein TrbK-alt [Algihabitans albus]
MAREPQILLRAVAVIALVAAALATAVQLDDESSPERNAADLSTDDPLRAELVRCRTIAQEELETDKACQAAWAENRRRFFAPARETGDGRDEE